MGATLSWAGSPSLNFWFAMLLGFVLVRPSTAVGACVPGGRLSPGWDDPFAAIKALTLPRRVAFLCLAHRAADSFSRRLRSGRFWKALRAS